VCRLYIDSSKPQQARTYQRASLQCSDGLVTACVNKASPTGVIQGVRNTTCCQEKCLLTVCGSTQVTFRDAVVSGVTSLTPLCVAGAARVTITGNSTFTHNWKDELDGETYFGGAIAAYESSTVTIGGDTRLQYNSATWGGAVFAGGNATVVIADASSITHNAAESGGGVFAKGRANVTIIGQASICHNTGKPHGGGMYVGDWTRVLITGSATLCNNTAAWIGGGILAANDARVVIDGSSRVLHNSAPNGTGGGVLAWHNSTVMITGNSSISSNTAGSGGGIAGWDDSTINLAGNSRIDGNRAWNGTGGGLILQGSSVLNTSSSSGTTIANNVCSETGAGISADGTTVVAIGGFVSFKDNTISRKVITDITTTDNGTNVKITSITEKSQTGADIRLVDFVNLTIASGANIDRCSRSVLLKRKSCEVGEFPLMEACVCCQVGTYNLIAPVESAGTKGQDCHPCPVHATCRANSIIPEKGYWHSNMASIQMHPCPLKEACKQPVSPSPESACLEGFTGNLCGVCSTGNSSQPYGMTTPLMCRPCRRPQVQFGVYAMVSFVTVCLIAFTVHATWRDNCLGGTHVRPSDMIKVLVHFLQYLVILGSVSAPWPEFLRVLFSISSVVFGAASGQALSLDCWLMHYAPWTSLHLAIQRQLVYFVAPVVVLAAVVLLDVLWWAAWQAAKVIWPSSHTSRGTPTPELLLVRKLPVMVLVVIFFAYPSLLRASASFFACLLIDRPNTGQYPVPEYAAYSILTHRWGYWVGYMDQPCFVGWHKDWALSLGLIGTLVFCVGLPVGLFLFLRVNQKRCSQAAFREHYAFLFRNYKQDKVYWEAMWALQTVLLTMVAVFHFTIGAYYSVLLLQTIFVASAALQAIFQPYALEKLHRLQLTATACLVFTATGTLTFFTFGSQDASVLQRAHGAIGMLVLVADAAFICWCLYQIVVSSQSGKLPRWLEWLRPHAWCQKAAECSRLGAVQSSGLCMRTRWPRLRGTSPSQRAKNLDEQRSDAGV